MLIIVGVSDWPYFLTVHIVGLYSQLFLIEMS